MTTATTVSPAPALTHRFELAGLGKAPFRVTGFYESKYQAHPDAPVQPGSSCDYCGTGIMNVFRIRGADGREFVVGIDCVHKTGDAGLVDLAKRAARDAKRAAAHAAWLASPEYAAQQAAAREEEARRAREAAALAAAKARRGHVGTVGAKVRIRVTVERVIPLPGAYGTRYLHVFRAAPDGSRVVWFASSRIDAAEGAELDVHATVEAHGHRDDEPETKVSRVAPAGWRVETRTGGKGRWETVFVGDDPHHAGGVYGTRAEADAVAAALPETRHLEPGTAVRVREV